MSSGRNVAHVRRQRLTGLLPMFGVVLLVGYALFPLLWTLLTSFKAEDAIVTKDLQYVPRHPNLDNYRELLSSSDFPRMLLNSAIVTALTVAMSVFVGGLAAYAISRRRFRGRAAIMLLYLSIRMFPFVLLLIPLFVMLRELHLLDTQFGLALAYTTFSLPAAIWFLKNFFDEIPVEMEEAAFVDGCSRLGALFRIVVPLCMPGIGATAILVAIGAWNEFLFALLLTTSNGSRTWPVGLQLMVGEFQLPYGQLAAGAMLSAIPIVVVYLLIGRTLVRGLMAGGLKG